MAKNGHFVDPKESLEPKSGNEQRRLNIGPDGRVHPVTQLSDPGPAEGKALRAEVKQNIDNLLKRKDGN